MPGGGSEGSFLPVLLSFPLPGFLGSATLPGEWKQRREMREGEHGKGEEGRRTEWGEKGIQKG